MSLYKQVTSKPWEYQGPVTGSGPESAFVSESEKIALTLFLVVVSVLFSLLAVTYYLRMDLGDWVPLSDPGVLWLNTGVLVISSVLFQIARNAAQGENFKLARATFIIGGVFAVLFVAGQGIVWQQLEANGLGVASNPSSSFFYLLTGVHLLHLIGGLWVWSKTSFRLFSQSETSASRLSIELCTTYWHFLLVLWVLLFAVLANT
jgi:cytochrome c oxidase subunit 3